MNQKIFNWIFLKVLIFLYNFLEPIFLKVNQKRLFKKISKILKSFLENLKENDDDMSRLLAKKI